MHIPSYTVSFSPRLFYYVTLRKRSYSQLDTRLHQQQLNINKDFQVIITEGLTDGHLLLRSNITAYDMCKFTLQCEMIITKSVSL